MKTSVVLLSVFCLFGGIAAQVFAQAYCPAPACQTCIDSPTYRIVYQTVYEQRQVAAYRVEYETVCEQRQVTSYKPVWETAVRENSYTVAKPVVETSYRDETYTVQRPVYETAEREESYTVMRPVYETAYQTQYRTVMKPVTTWQTRYVDQGCYADQMVLKPGLPANRLQWQSAACTVDPLTGRTVYQRPGFYWVPTQRGRYEVKKVWQPNVVAQQVQQTNYVPETVVEQVPYQVCKYVPEQVVRKVPYQVCRMATEQCVRKVPVRTCRMVYERRVEQVPYKVCRMVAQQETISVPRVVEKRVPVTYTYNVPRVVCYRIPLDACGNPLVPAVSPPPTGSSNVEAPTPAKKSSRDPADEKPALDSGAGPIIPGTEKKLIGGETEPLETLPPLNNPTPANSVHDYRRA
ncbi:MAG: hypothetical protein JW959_01295 [Pirellulales bacterium]|nr:hypothetical protein [Pirellulales bacterium]